jgi:hypothetical protein
MASMAKGLDTKQIFGNTLLNENVLRHEANFDNTLLNENVLRHEANFRKYNFIRLAIEGASFFTKHENKGRCFFAEGSKTVCM